MLITNIKNLPENRTYFTECGYSQQYPWVEIKRTAKTVTVAKVNVAPDPEWKPEMIPGGFCAHCTNQSKQTWLFDSISEDYTRTIRLNKNGEYRFKSSTKYIEDRAVEFYDYNF